MKTDEFARHDGTGLAELIRRKEVSASEVLWIGDSWVLVPGSQVTRVRDLARATGAIGPSDDYVNAGAPATLQRGREHLDDLRPSRAPVGREPGRGVATRDEARDRVCALGRRGVRYGKPKK